MSTRRVRAQVLSVAALLACLVPATAQEPVVVFKGHEGEVISVGFHDAGNKVISGDSLTYVQLWDMKEKKQVSRVGGWGKLAVASTSQDGQILATVFCQNEAAPYCYLYRPAKGLETATSFRLIEGGMGKYGVVSTAVTTSKDPLMATCVFRKDSTYAIYLHDADTQKEMVHEACKSPAGTLAFSPDGKLLVSGHEDGNVTIWKTDTMKAQGTLTAFEKGAVGCVAIDPKGHTLAVAGGEKSVKLFDLAKMTEREMKLEGHDGPVHAITYSPDGKYIATGGKDRTVKIWEAGAARAIATIEAHRNTIRALAFSADGKMLVSGSDDKHVKVWDIEKVLEKKD